MQACVREREEHGVSPAKKKKKKKERERERPEAANMLQVCASVHINLFLFQTTS
jgi:hypothetical protein